MKYIYAGMSGVFMGIVVLLHTQSLASAFLAAASIVAGLAAVDEMTRKKDT